MNRIVVGALVLSAFAAPSAQSALLDRGGGMIYDTALNITWLQNANFAETSGYDADGRMTWAEANDWAGNLEFGGFDDWRLPVWVDLDTAGCNYSYAGTDCGFNVDVASGEMANLYYATLGNIGLFDGPGSMVPGAGFVNRGPFVNIQDEIYWLGSLTTLESGAVRGVYFAAWGDQSVEVPTDSYRAWAVRDGDVIPTTVPEPGVLGLVLTGLCALAVGRRRRAT